ncbi:MAG: hypothetical protein IJQ73_11460 [Kiritimatiellae bacterium]|nr:hypothetical protein [Kiritimatiellia bacterium]
MMIDIFAIGRGRSRPSLNCNDSRSGAALLVLVLTVALVGILMGFGRQLAHRFAVERRLNRTYQIEKMLAARDAIAIANAVTEKMKRPTDFRYECPSLAFGNASSRLVVGIDYIPDRDREDMVNTNNWRVFTSDSSKETVDVNIGVNASDSDKEKVLEFKAAVSTNDIYVAAAAKRAEACWLDCEFGYLYQLDLHAEGGTVNEDNEEEAVSPYNLGMMNLYLVGVSDSPWSEKNKGERICDGWANYREMMRKRPWYRMSLSANSDPENPAQIGKSRRDFSLQYLDAYENGVVCAPVGLSDFLQPWRKRNPSASKTDHLKHPGGFLLSETSFCGYGSTSSGGLLFSRRGDLVASGIMDSDAADKFLEAFRESVIVIEHEFPTNAPPPNVHERQVTVDSFVMREPTTYAVSIYNKALEDKDYDGKTVTWIFQTQPPTGEGIVGEQCILDTFGREQSNWYRERRGEVPDSPRQTTGQ